MWKRKMQNTYACYIIINMNHIYTCYIFYFLQDGTSVLLQIPTFILVVKISITLCIHFCFLYLREYYHLRKVFFLLSTLSSNLQSFHYHHTKIARFSLPRICRVGLRQMLRRIKRVWQYNLCFLNIDSSLPYLNCFYLKVAWRERESLWVLKLFSIFFMIINSNLFNGSTDDPLFKIGRSGFSVPDRNDSCIIVTGNDFIGKHSNRFYSCSDVFVTIYS